MRRDTWTERTMPSEETFTSEAAKWSGKVTNRKREPALTASMRHESLPPRNPRQNVAQFGPELPVSSGKEA